MKIILVLAVLFVQSLSFAGGQHFYQGMRLGGDNGYRESAIPCNPDSDEVGTRTVGGTVGEAGSNGVLWCILHTPECSGPLNTPYMYHGDTTTREIKLSLYQDNGDSVPGTEDALVDYSSAITSSTIEWASGTLQLSGNVDVSYNYWICINLDSGWSRAYATGTGKSLYYKDLNVYPNIPATLESGFAVVADRDFSTYFSIGE